MTFRDLTTFLSKHKATKELPYTHTSMCGGSCHIPTDKQQLFYKLYTKEISKGTELYMTEKHIPKYGPVVIDFDFEFKEKLILRQINNRVIKNMSTHATKLLKEIFGNDNDYTCIVLQRPNQYEKRNNIADGLHIQYPFIVCEYKYQHLLRTKFMETYNLDITCDNTFDKIYDENIIERVNWCMYGSTKKNKSPYEVVKIYNSTLKWNDMSILKRVKLLSIRNKPVDLLIMPLKSIKVITPLKSIKVIKTNNENEILMQYYTVIDTKLESRLNLLDLEKSNSYNRWFSICNIIKNTGCSLRLFIEFSKKLNDYDFEECIKKWNDNNKEHMKMAKMNRLNILCIEDNPIKYEELVEIEGGNLKKILNELYDLGGGSDNTLAKVFHEMYKNLFIYDSEASFGGNRKEGTWLTYDEYGKYHICDGMEKAKQILSNEIINTDFLERLDNYIITSEHNKDMSEKQKKQDILSFKKKGNAMLLKLKNTTNKCHIVEQLKEFYHGAKIFEKLDEVNPYLIGFDNGVYDLQNREFRKANPEDLMYISTGYDYHESKNKYVNDLNKIIKSIYPDELERDYEMTVFSFILSGIMHLQEFYMMIGTGGNGKGILTLLINMVMGKKYCTTISIECFKNKGNISANEKSQQLAGCKYARGVFVTECNFKENEEFEYNLVKTMSGGDEQNCKFLYKEQTRYIPKFNLYFVTNDQIPIKVKDESVPRRARICPHRVSFVDNNDYDKNDKYLALAEIGLEEKIRQDIEYKHAFFAILLEYYFKFIDNGKKIKIPQSLNEENIYFKNLNNPIGNFIKDCLIMTKNINDKITISLLTKILSGYDNSVSESIKSLSQYLTKQNIKISRIRGYPTCSGIKFKSYDNLKELITPKCINMLLEQQFIEGDTINDE